NFTRRDFAAYIRVNTLLADTLAPLLKPNDVVWVHDYHLIPMAEELRRVGAKQRIGFFLHTPFPSLGVLATLPRYVELLRSLCAYDLVGFQTIEELTAFHDAIRPCRATERACARCEACLSARRAAGREKCQDWSDRR